MALADPPSESVLVASSVWVQQLLTGSFAVVIGTIAVAMIGFAMLDGRLPVRRGMLVLLGCFVVFGAPTIAAGLMGLVVPSEAMATVAPSQALVVPENVPRPAGPATGYDPYAGASVPVRN